MSEKEISVFFVRIVQMIILFIIIFVGLNLIGCGGDETETDGGTNQLTVEEQKDLARFVEYVLFPTSPYVDKSWVETDVPEEELASNPIDFPTETAAIQQVYTEVYNAWEARDFDTAASHFYPSTIRVVFLCGAPEHPVGVAVRRLLSTDSLRNPYNVCNGVFYKLSSTPLLTEFYIRRKNVRVPWPEASAKTADNAYIYLTKRGDRWFMNELVVTQVHSGSVIKKVTDRGDTRKYFDDPRYKAPE